MARIAGVDITRDKRLEISLTYIYGVGPSMARHVCEATSVAENTRVRDLTDEEVAYLRRFELLEDYLSEWRRPSDRPRIRFCRRSCR